MTATELKKSDLIIAVIMGVSISSPCIFIFPRILVIFLRELLRS
jgi:hypothetical protein